MVSEDSGIKKLVHKLQPHKHDKGEDKEESSSGGATLNLDGPNHSHPRHRWTEGYVESGLHGGMQELMNALSQEEVLAVISNLVRAQAVVGTGAAIREGLEVLGSEQGMAVVGKLVAAQAVVFAKASMDPLARQAAREAAQEAISGSYDGVERKVTELLTAQGGKLRYVMPALVSGAAMFLVPLLLCMWRFALFGLGPVR